MWNRPQGPPPSGYNRDHRYRDGSGYPGQSHATYGGQSALGNQGYGYSAPNDGGYGGYLLGPSHSYSGAPGLDPYLNSYSSAPIYSRPLGPPPSHYQVLPSGYSRPAAPPPLHSSYSSHELGSYQRPPGPPPGWSPEQVQAQANSVSVFQENDHDVYIQEAQNVHGALFAPQQFSSQVQGYNYQYSQCNGRRKALLIGINYIGTKNQLRGCINDVHNVRNFLQQHGYDLSDIVTLTDDQTNARAVPTRKNILDAMQWLVKDAQPNDSLFFHYSGHGGQVADQDGDEYDGYDECIYPVDFETAGEIIDDIMHDIMVKLLPAGCRLTALFDCCHLGSALDLPYTYSTKGLEKEPNVAAEAGQGLLSAVTSYMRGDKLSAVTKVFDAVGTFIEGDNNSAIQQTKRTKTSPADVIMLLGCKDDQTSADALEAGQATGAMSYAFIKVMNAGKRQTYLSLLQNTRSVLSGKYSQKPQLSSSHPIDVNIEFIF